MEGEAFRASPFSVIVLSYEGVLILNETEFFKGSCNPANIIKSAAFDLAFIRANPDYMEPDGLWAFVGSQGSGKTLSCVLTFQKLAQQYPKALLCSNIEVHGLGDRQIIPFTDYDQIKNLDNGICGIIFLIDEAQVLWNCIESRGIPIEEIGTLCQNRKSRRVVLFTSQVYGRVAKPIREQYKYVIFCRSILKYIQWNTVVDPCADGYTTEDDGHFEGKILKRCIWFHHPRNYQAYDTLNKINRLERKGKEVKRNAVY